MPSDESGTHAEEVEQAQEKLTEAVDLLADVQDNLDLTEEQNEMLRESKSGIAAVSWKLENPNTVIDL